MVSLLNPSAEYLLVSWNIDIDHEFLQFHSSTYVR